MLECETSSMDFPHIKCLNKKMCATETDKCIPKLSNESNINHFKYIVYD